MLVGALRDDAAASPARVFDQSPCLRRHHRATARISRSVYGSLTPGSSGCGSGRRQQPEHYWLDSMESLPVESPTPRALFPALESTEAAGFDRAVLGASMPSSSQWVGVPGSKQVLTQFDEVGAAHGVRRAQGPGLGHDTEPVWGPADPTAAPERIRGLEAFELGCSERMLRCCAEDWMGTAQCTASPGSMSLMQYAPSETSSSDSWAAASSNATAGILMQTSLPSARTLRFWRDVASPGAPGPTAGAGAGLAPEAEGTPRAPGSRQLRALRRARGGLRGDRHGPRGGPAAACADAATPSPSTPRMGSRGSSTGPSPGSGDEARASSASPTQSDVEAALELMLTPPRQPFWTWPLPSSPPTSPGHGADAGASARGRPPPSPRSGTPPARPRLASGLLAAARNRFKESVGASGRSSEFGRTLLRELDAINSSPQLGKKASSTMPALHVGSVSPIRGGQRLAW